jgi:hypothetical protein
MAAVAHMAFGQHELPVHSADDAISRQQKMLQQRHRQLQKLQKGAFGHSVTAQLDTPFDAAPKKAAGWEKMLMRCGIDVGVDGATCPEKLSLQDPSGFVRIRVPSVEDMCPSLRAASFPSPSNQLEAVSQDVSQSPCTAPTPTEALLFTMLQTPTVPTPTTPERSESDSVCDTPSQRKAMEKKSSFKLWRPWGSSARSGSKLACHESDIIVEEKRVSIAPAETAGIGERCTTLSVGRAATPFQTGDECADVLELSIGSGLSSIPCFADDIDDASQDDALQADTDRIEDVLNDELFSRTGDRDEDSVDSGIEDTLNEWKQQEKQSPAGKRNRFNRFMPSVSMRSWRSSSTKVENLENSVNRVTVTPRAVDID